jgi:hypothetical protein
LYLGYSPCSRVEHETNEDLTIVLHFDETGPEIDILLDFKFKLLFCADEFLLILKRNCYEIRWNLLRCARLSFYNLCISIHIDQSINGWFVCLLACGWIAMWL